MIYEVYHFLAFIWSCLVFFLMVAYHFLRQSNMAMKNLVIYVKRTG